ncbi:glycoside hydrolase family 16 protein [Pedobacter sp. GR22-6]|uniref:glycoside hydrolase family 16 protein n=1 Tax=Pedobacter sp. GR22-6 TaxID=3127957 RepID=UPI00307D7F30
MAYLFYCSILIGIFANTLSLAQGSYTSTKRKLIWSDEFNYVGLPDAKKWNYETGFIRNQEKQYYTKADYKNVNVKNGNLIITARKERHKNAEYTSASINTLKKVDFEGDFRIEIRAKLPYGKGIWPAIWMMGTNIQEMKWPKCAEFDIMEFVGHTPNTIHANMHWWDAISTKPDRHSTSGSKTTVKNLHNKYHIYAMERKGENVRFFVDNLCYFNISAPSTAYKDSFSAPLYLMINTAVGGTWGGPVDDSIFPQRFLIDYVRAYSLK